MKTGLVLPGGGARGAYQVGVWQAMTELGIAKNVAIISGISVGAINAALFADKDAFEARRLWMNIKPSDIMKINAHRIGDIIYDLIKTHKRFRDRIAYLFSSEGYFSREGLERLLDTYLNYDRIANSDKKIYAVCADVSGKSNSEVLLSTLGIPVGKSEYIALNGANAGKIKKILMASSSIPFVFDRTDINKTGYYDGGISEGVPITPVYREKCDVIYVIPLDKKQVIEGEDYPGTKIINICLNENYRSVIPRSLNFSQELISKRIEMGYKDGMRILREHL